MDDLHEHHGLQWKWVWITLGMFLLLYVLPLLGATTLGGALGHKLIGGWSFGGVIVISAIAGMLSEGVTIWEPAIAGVLMTILWYGGFEILLATRGLPLKLDVTSLVIVLIAIFGLSLLGAGLGEGIQNLSHQRKQPPKEKPDQHS